MQQHEPTHAPPDGRGAQPSRRVFYLGKLGHDRAPIDTPHSGGENDRVTDSRSRPTPAAVRATRTPAVRRTLLFILVLNAMVVLVKVYVGVRTGALSAIGAALESALDMFNNVMGMALTSVAAQEPDELHPYGHEKFETLGALAIVGFLSISCFELLREGISNLIRGRVPHEPDISVIVLMGATALVNVFIVRYESRRGRELSSGFLLADAAHTRTDIYVTLLVLASLLLTRAGYGWADAALALVVAGIIARTGYQIVRDSVPVLVDARAVDAEAIRELARAIAGVVDVPAVRSRRSPSGILYAEVTITVPARLPVSEAHALSDEVEARMADRFGAAEITVHVEPV
jgi:cation diffusion facilitator family transporter